MSQYESIKYKIQDDALKLSVLHLHLHLHLSGPSSGLTHWPVTGLTRPESLTRTPFPAPPRTKVYGSREQRNAPKCLNISEVAHTSWLSFHWRREAPVANLVDRITRPRLAGCRPRWKEVEMNRQWMWRRRPCQYNADSYTTSQGWCSAEAALNDCVLIIIVNFDLQILQYYWRCLPFRIDLLSSRATWQFGS